jgi:alpha,alpha-trehalase
MTTTQEPRDSVALPTEAYDAVLFDMDGVITDTAEVHRKVWAEVFDAYLRQASGSNGYLQPSFSIGDYHRHVDGKQRADGVRDFLRSRGIRLAEGSSSDPADRETVWGLANRKNEAFTRRIEHERVRLFRSSVALVRALQAAQVGVAVISASRNCQHVLSSAGVGDLFPVRVDGLECERLHLAGKPDPGMFLEAAHRLGSEVSRSVVVEDAVAGVEAGRAGHFGLVIGVDRNGHAEELYQAGADAVVDDLAAIHLC